MYITFASRDKKLYILYLASLPESPSWSMICDSVVEPLSRVFNRELVQQVCGIILTNAFELESQRGLYGVLERCLMIDLDLVHPVSGFSPSSGLGRCRLVGLFETASLMNHDCVGNVRIVIPPSNKVLKAIASVDIKKGTDVGY